MILYKYMSFTSACSVIDNHSIGFSCLEDLNDPFEGRAIFFENSDDTICNVTKSSYRNRLSRHYGILSLTRNPLNAQMWSHYGDNHRGVVIGIDIEKANLFDEKSCIIPVQFGEIIYTSTMPQNILPAPTIESLMSIGEEVSSFREHDHDLFKNAFLMKNVSWAYEEEVRVVKNIYESNRSRHSENSFENLAGKWTKIIIEGRPLYCLSIPKESIVEVYMGSSSYENVSRLEINEDFYINTREKWKQSGINVQSVCCEKNSWDLECVKYKFNEEIV